MSLRRTPLYDRHADRGAKFTDFGGWEMPVQFGSIREEHRAVRESIGVFDVSHMSEIGLVGDDATALAQRLTTADADALEPGEARYTMLPDEAGTIVDDAILYRLEADRFLVVANAGHDAELTERFEHHQGEATLEVTVENETDRWGMLAVQGPRSADAIPADTSAIGTNEIDRVTVADVTCWCAGTGYTGEDGVELLIPWEETPTVEEVIDGERCGLGARDTLRMEMGYVLAGNEFDREDNRRTPYEAGLDFAVELDTDPPCIGRDALVEARESGPAERLVGLGMEDRGIPRSGYPITDSDGERIGIVTSGTMSPTLDRAIGLGYVSAAAAEPGTPVAVEVRDTSRRASIESLPFVEPGR